MASGHLSGAPLICLAYRLFRASPSLGMPPAASRSPRWSPESLGSVPCPSPSVLSMDRNRDCYLGDKRLGRCGGQSGLRAQLGCSASAAGARRLTKRRIGRSVAAGRTHAVRRLTSRALTQAANPAFRPGRPRGAARTRTQAAGGVVDLGNGTRNKSFFSFFELALRYTWDFVFVNFYLADRAAYFAYLPFSRVVPSVSLCV